MHNHSTKNDPTFVEFSKIHSDITKPSKLWEVAKKYPHLTSKCFQVARLICRDSYDDPLLCEFCGKMYNDVLKHRCLSCDNYKEDRDQFWHILINDFSIDLSVAVFHLDDDDFLCVLLGGVNEIKIEDFEEDRFLKLCINFICKMNVI